MTTPPRELVGLREYARRRGVTLQAVRKAIESGRLKRSVVEAGGRRRLDVASADREWERRTHTRKAQAEQVKKDKRAAARAPKPPSLSLSSASGEEPKRETARAKRKKDAAPAAELRPESGRGLAGSAPPSPASPPVRRRRGRPSNDLEEGDGAEGEVPEDLAEALRRKESALADLNELKVAEKELRLVDAAELELKFFGIGRTVRERLLSIAPRLGPELCPADPNHGELRIRQEITEALEELGDERHAG